MRAFEGKEIKGKETLLAHHILSTAIKFHSLYPFHLSIPFTSLSLSPLSLSLSLSYLSLPLYISLFSLSFSLAYLMDVFVFVFRIRDSLTQRKENQYLYNTVQLKCVLNLQRICIQWVLSGDFSNVSQEIGTKEQNKKVQFLHQFQFIRIVLYKYNAKRYNVISYI